jgi:hypothetical protein
MLVAGSRIASADEGAAAAADASLHLDAPQPAPDNQVSAHYGVGIVAEIPASTGRLCDDTNPCILGSGAGVAARLGFDTPNRRLLGIVYSVTKQDSAKLYRLATLQQLRAEGRLGFNTHRIFEPFVLGGLGAAAYGNEWAIDTYGPLISLGVGGRLEVAHAAFVALSLNYRGFRSVAFTDDSGVSRPVALVQLVGFDISFETLDKL